MQALSQPDALISVVSMIRRGSVLVSFAIGAFLLREKNLRSKAVDLALMLASMVLLYLGSR
jgi:transporter family protein